MIVELRGVEFVNKGAELMLHSICQKFKKQCSDVRFVMEANPRVTKQNLLENNILPKPHFQSRFIKLNTISNYIPKFLYRDDFVADKDVDIVIDGSGFAFGDKWGAVKAGDRMADKVVRWKMEGKIVILMPQAFGPFTNPKLISKMQIILENADLIFARDSISYEHLKRINSKGNNVFLRPDFTPLLKVNKFQNTLAGNIAIIPNVKMIAGRSEMDIENYYRIFRESIKIVQNKGLKPFFLIHEVGADKSLAERINKQLDNPLEIIVEENALNVKAIIADCKATLTSRFHGLVSSLSQGVPSLCTSWSHKYEMLLKDYDFDEGLLKLNTSTGELEDIIDSVFITKYEAVRDGLIEKSKEQIDLVEDTWAMIFSLIENSKR